MLLGTVEGVIGKSQQLFRVMRILFAADRNAKAPCDLNFSGIGHKWLRLERFSHSFSKTKRTQCARGWHDDQKLFTPIATYRVVRARTTDHAAGCFLQNRIAAEMPVLVVDVLKMVEVRQNNAKRTSFAQLAGVFAMQGIQGGIAVDYAGQAVVSGPKEQFFPGDNLAFLKVRMRWPIRSRARNSSASKGFVK